MSIPSEHARTKHRERKDSGTWSQPIQSLGPPPRPVPRGQILLHPWMQLAALVWLVLVGLLAWIGFSHYDPVNGFRLDANNRSARGQVVQVTNTDYTEGDDHVFRYDFTFGLPNGQQQAGTCYSALRRFRPGEGVTVEYHPERTSLSRIKGTRLALRDHTHWGLPACLVTVSALGAVIAAAGIWQGRRVAQLLRRGRLATGVVTACQEIQGAESDDSRVTLLLSLPGGKTSVVKDDVFGRVLTVGDSHVVLYDPARLTNGRLVEGIEPRVRVSPSGQWEGGARGVWVALVAVSWMAGAGSLVAGLAWLEAVWGR